MARRWSVRKLLLFALNLASTLLTLFTGLRENPLVVFVTGRYDHIRARMRDSSLSYRIVPDDLLEIGTLANLTEVGKSYRFFSAPSRGPDNLGTDFSMCLKVNSMNVSILNIYYDDFWGKGSRRTQIYTYSISAPKCDIINFNAAWVQACIAGTTNNNNATECYASILDNFDALKLDLNIQRGTETDFGADGVPFIKCRGRPPKTFDFTADLMLHQSYWAGGEYYVLFLTSDCLATPAAMSRDRRYGLYKVVRVDQEARVVGAIDNYGWFTLVVTSLYGIVSITMIITGVFAAIVQTTEVYYIPRATRYLGERRFIKYLLPSMPVATLAPGEGCAPIRFKGALLMASDVWMNHWLYIILSILDALVNVRMAYIVFQMGTWMLSKKTSLANFLFMCSAVTRLTWILCLAHTLLRLAAHTLLHASRSLKVMKTALREKLEWYVDASTLFMSYKIYSLLLFAFLYLLLITQGATTFMMRSGPKRGVFGGSPNIAQFWQSEIACDLAVFIPILLVTGHVGSSLLLLTKYKHVPNNAVMRLLQRRYIVVGWDAFVAMEALGINPHIPKRIVDNIATANCSLGALLQQLYTSGPSGHVNLAGDFIFLDGGFSRDPVLFHYPVKQAVAMGICRPLASGTTTGKSNKYAVVTDDTTTITKTQETAANGTPPVHPVVVHKVSKSLFERKLRIFMDSRFGRILLVDQDQPGKVQKSATTSLSEFLVQDALSLATILDIKHLLGNDKKLIIA